MPENLAVATKATNEVLCLTIYVELGGKEVIRIIDILTKKGWTKPIIR